MHSVAHFVDQLISPLLCLLIISVYVCVINDCLEITCVCFYNAQKIYILPFRSQYLSLSFKHLINKLKSESVTCSVVSNSLLLCGLQPARLLSPWNAPGKNTGVACHSLLQRMFPNQGLNPSLPYCREILYHVSQGSSINKIAVYKNISHLANCNSTIQLLVSCP